MKLKDINAEIVFDFWVEPVLDNEPIRKGLGQLHPCDSNVYILTTDNGIQKIGIRDQSVRIDLNFHLKRGCAHLAEVVQLAKNGTAFLKVIFFNGDIVELGNIEVGINEEIELTAKQNQIKFKNIEELNALLAEKCSMSVGSDTFFLMLSGAAADGDFESEGTYDSSSKNRTVIPDKQYRAFAIYGERIIIPVEKRAIDKSTEIFFATKIVLGGNQEKKGALRLARGCISFSNFTKTGRIRALAAGAMSQLTKESGSYLKKWDEYGSIEGNMLLARAKSIGRIEYDNFEPTEKGVKFFISSAIPPELSEGDEMELTSEEPIYLTNPDITWEDYSKTLEEEFFSKKEKNIKIEMSSDTVHAPIISISESCIELALSPLPSKQLFLILSINGDKIQIKRRMKARSAILEGTSANPLLGLLIEENGVIPDIQRVTKIEPLTPFVKEKIFKHPPTEKQVEAIEIALNTPDIALIQGPPGTGKTTVITAILERLNEEYDKRESIRGQILVSGFQHDAVENIVSRLSVNALPAVKFGKRSSDSEFTEDAVTKKMSLWCSGIAGEIRKKNPQISQTEDQVKLAGLFVSYSLCPSKTNTYNLLEKILALPRDVISNDIVSQTKDILKSIQDETVIFDPLTIRLIRSLRITETGFLDDGPSRAIDLLERIEGDIDTSEIEILKKASLWKNDNVMDFIDELKHLKEKLLLRYMPVPEFRIEKPREDVLGIVAKVSAQLDKAVASRNKHDAVLAEFLHELENNPDGVRKSIEDYNFIFAATTQQSDGAAIRKAKDASVSLLKYDTVIIDEAARTSPRDLMIPMSQAEKRIILVGDHRQLPHLIDDEIARALEGIESGNLYDSRLGGDFVKVSMFEYLFRRLKKLEEKDGIKRTVTLDAQYRTHPILGNFVSDNFYKQYNEGYRSPLPEKHFSQNLQDIQGKAAVWIDVPNSRGDEKFLQSKSRQRIVEAQIIAEYLSRWINSEDASGLSFGVISFYKAQVNAVYEALRTYGITEREMDGTWRIVEKYRFYRKNVNGREQVEERLRIGTVDAFQGMEFDIVFLSVVRSIKTATLPSSTQHDTDYDKIQQRIFGHLMSKNRLCVSMSRQKKVLVIVGDGRLMQSQVASDAVPALKNYYELCKKQGVVL